MSFTVISVGDDPQLLSLRDAVLRSAGMRVLTASDYQKALSFIAANNADVLLLCYSMALDLRQKLAKAFRERYPDGRIIAITNMPQARPPVEADAFIYGIEGAEALIKAVCDQVEGKREGSGTDDGGSRPPAESASLDDRHRKKRA